MNNEEFDAYASGINERRTDDKNFELFLIYQQGLYNNYAFWGAKDYPREPLKLDNTTTHNRELTPEEEEEALHDVMRELTAIARANEGLAV